MATYKKSPAADIDLIEIWNYISQSSFSKADKFLDLLEEQFKLLAEQPMIGRARSDLAPELRSFPVGNYITFYRPKDGFVEIVRVLNAARNIEAMFGN